MSRTHEPRVTLAELETAAAKHGLALQYDCGGCRVVRDGTPLFPDSGVCSTVTRREALHFITGYNYAWRELRPPPKWPDDLFLSGYLRCMFWTSEFNSNVPGDYEAYGNWRELFAQLAPETLDAAATVCNDFQADNHAALAEAYEHPGYDAERAGSDLWLTRNGHGCGYWDRDLGETGKRLTEAAHALGSVDLYRGDDGKLYF